MGATSIAHPRRLREGYFDRYLKGKGVDMGCGEDPVTPDCLRYDIQYGHDAQRPDLSIKSFDWVFSSHCLEHLPRPQEALFNWWSLIKPGGHLVCSVPDWCLYEQKLWPTHNNPDHKWSFSMTRIHPKPHDHHLVLLDLIADLPRCQVLSYRLLDAGFNYEERGYDRTWYDKAEAEIEVICRKMPSDYWID